MRIFSTLALVLAGALVAGCSSMSGTRAKQNDELNTRLASLEGQVTALNQRVEEISTGASQQETAGFDASAERQGTARAAKPLSVRQTQRALSSAGFYKGPVDGKEGPQTKKAIREFQQAQGLKVDGIVGNSTRRALAKYLDEPQE
ncbi:MAG: peptidoglycan-binding protein [Candidatus Omnitrophica bacterium]|nr:peptidoglycan-binding protein [Candidatus Omnitrophota bacterium]